MTTPLSLFSVLVFAVFPGSVYASFDCIHASKTKVKLLVSDLKEFKRDCGVYPTTVQGISSLNSKSSISELDCKKFAPNGYLANLGGPEQAIKDGNGNDFLYSSDGRHFQLRCRSSSDELYGSLVAED